MTNQIKLIDQLTNNTEKMLAVERNILEATAAFRKELDAYKHKDAELREAIYDAMDKTGTKSFENELLKLTLVEPSTRRTLDTTRLKEELPELYEDYSKDSSVKGFVKITVKTIVKRIK